MKMALIGFVAGASLGFGGIHIETWEYWAVMVALSAAYVVGRNE